MLARLLIVEDEMLVAMELQSILEDLGYEVLGIAPDLASARRHFDEEIDLALVDLNLRDGLTGPQIGATLGAKGVTVLFVTANPRLLGQGISGAIGVITKPADEEMVRSAVEYALAVRTGRSVQPPATLRLFGAG
ncbi:response regulator [Altererythrobacter soli]|uniref:Response regulator n=1 Tax=Croceibacterium soli TaxID=1739690 RepID=A0A6I4UQN8_9SPHN|nr:response regulator [Croceibacterium soli]MXP41101.1 response regulator [Croceibacterium soli]